MKISAIYMAILSRPFFIAPSRVAARSRLIDAYLDHDLSALSADISAPLPPLQMVLVDAKGRRSSGGSAGGASQGTVAVVPLKGDMFKDDTPCSHGTLAVAAMVREAASEPGVEGIVLDIDSGGGSIDSVAPLLQAIDFAHAQGKPVVAMADLCASAAYYVACHADTVMASNAISSEFGSVGVMTQIADYEEQRKQRGVRVHTVYSRHSADKNLPYHSALKGDYKPLQDEQLDPLAADFQQAVRRARQGRLVEDTPGVISGRMFYARQAVQVGLADMVGRGLDSAVAEVRRLAADRRLRAVAAVTRQ